MAHRNAEVQAAQKQLDNLAEHTHKRTKQLLEEQEAVLTNDYEKLAKKVRGEAMRLDALVSELDVLNQEKIQAQKHIREQKDALQLLLDEKKRLDYDISKSNSELKETWDSVNALRDEVLALESTKSELIMQIHASNNKIDENKETILMLEAQLDTLRTKHASKKAKYEHEIAILTTQYVDITEKIEESKANEHIIREQLVARSIALDEREKNLRIREQKVEQNEQRILANSNLLNL